MELLGPKKGKTKSIIGAHVFSEYHAYCTKTFTVRQFFDDEIVNISEMCIFELQLDEYPLPPDASIMLDVELMHSPFLKDSTTSPNQI